jgi:hypothetical protein
MPEEGLHREPGQEYVEELHAELRSGYGLDSTVITSGVWPRLKIRIPYAAAGFADTFEDNVLAIEGPGGRWSYWWPWVEEICEAGNAAKAAEIIAETLSIDARLCDEEQTVACYPFHSGLEREMPHGPSRLV